MADMVYCRGCGKQIHRSARTCPACGARQTAAARKDKITTAVLAFFLGGFGVHRFYLGQWWGVFYLIMSCTGIPMFIAFIEFIVILCTSDASWDAKYNKNLGDDDRASGANNTPLLVIAAVGALVLFVPFIGIMAAIALPAYQDYMLRAKVAEAYAMAKPAEARIASYYAQTKGIPPSLQEAGIASQLPQDKGQLALDKDTGVLTVSFTHKALADKTLTLTPTLDDQDTVVWTCESQTMANKLLPAECRKN